MPLPGLIVLLVLLLVSCQSARPVATPMAPPAGPLAPDRAAAPIEAPRPVLTEAEKIERLLIALETSDAIFIRNGSEYKGKRAAEHLRRKWKSAGDEVRTAVQFIDLLASKSSSSGKPYVVKQGAERFESAVWFTRELQKIEGK